MTSCRFRNQMGALGTRQRLVFSVLLYTGLRIGDAAALGRQHIQADGSLTVRAQKNGKRVYLGVRKALQAALDAGPHGKPGVLASYPSEYGFPYTKESLATGSGTTRSNRPGSSSARRTG